MTDLDKVSELADNIIDAIDNARQNEDPHKVRKGIIDSLYWMNAYQLIQSNKDELMKAGVYPRDVYGIDWVTEVMRVEIHLDLLMSAHRQSKQEVTVTTSISSPHSVTKAQVGLGNVPDSDDPDNWVWITNTLSVDQPGLDTSDATRDLIIKMFQERALGALDAAIPSESTTDNVLYSKQIGDWFDQK